MNIGIPREDPKRDRRIALTPAAVHTLISAGANIYIEKNAGEGAHFTDQKFEEVGAKIVYTQDEVYKRADVILKVSPPSISDTEKLLESQCLISAMHLAVAKQAVVETLLNKKIFAVAIELIEDEKGDMPVLSAMSEIAGLMSIQIASRYLENTNAGRGILLGGLTGVAPAAVVILGAGTVGRAAARVALGVGAQVTVLDKDLNRLRSLEQQFNYRITTGLVNEYNIRKAIEFADVLIGAVLIKGEKAPRLVTEDMVKSMKPGSVIIDVSIDQGGCIETSRPTTLDNPTYILHNVIHYCVPNMAANVARSAAFALTNSLLPFLTELVEVGFERMIKENPGFAKGVVMYDGYCTQESIAKRFELEFRNINSLIK